MTDLNFDSAKTADERIMDRVIQILESTIPEQTTDAMGDYAKALALLEETNDFRVGAIVPQLKDLYIYPERNLHNNLMKDVHDIKEMMHEERIDSVLKSKKTTVQPTARGLGNLAADNKKWLVIAAAAVGMYMLFK